ncbi:hypothetical protein ARMGADRAFT_532870 [Armillaria gallica]|uniref:Uncharacterized protein n=1 Tax=Armillaria gallica TaxID=47427 RepID=A0A2H3D711_ARMGA|nr:hypothetical protein ARMGADRAFT_532870 [Armillaria gallica]
MHVVLAIFLELAVFLVLVQAFPCIIGSITAFVHAAYVKSVFLRIFFPMSPTTRCFVKQHILFTTSHGFTFAFPQKWSQMPAASQREPSSDVVKAHSDGLSVDTLRWLLSASSEFQGRAMYVLPVFITSDPQLYQRTSFRFCHKLDPDTKAKVGSGAVDTTSLQGPYILRNAVWHLRHPVLMIVFLSLKMDITNELPGNHLIGAEITPRHRFRLYIRLSCLRSV